MRVIWNSGLSGLSRAILVACVVLMRAGPLSASADEFGLTPAPVVAETRIYVLDCGSLANDRPEDYQLTREDVRTTLMSDMCYLIVNPKGTLMWDTGLADRLLGRPLYENMVLGHYALIKFNTVRGQLADIGYDPSDITYLALSHGHFDHSGNANMFANSTWLVSKLEWQAMFDPPPGAHPMGVRDFQALTNARTVFIGEDYDVFGDGTVIIKQAFGHSPGSSVLFVNLKNTGGVLLVGDLYHYPEERTLRRMSVAESKTSAPQSRERIEAFARAHNAQIWIAHDLELFRRLRKEPAFYD